MKFNPSVKEFLEQHEDTTLIAFYFSLLWRFFIAYCAVIIGAACIIALLTAIFVV